MSFTWVGGRPSVDFTATLGKRLHKPVERIPARPTWAAGSTRPASPIALS